MRFPFHGMQEGLLGNGLRLPRPPVGGAGGEVEDDDPRVELPQPAHAEVQPLPSLRISWHAEAPDQEVVPGRHLQLDIGRLRPDPRPVDVGDAGEGGNCVARSAHRRSAPPVVSVLPAHAAAPDAAVPAAFPRGDTVTASRPRSAGRP